MQGEFCVNSVPIGIKLNAAGVLNGVKRHRLAVNTGSYIQINGDIATMFIFCAS